MIIDRDYNEESFCNGCYQDFMKNISELFTPNAKIPTNCNKIINLINDSDVNDFNEIIMKESLHAADKANNYSAHIKNAFDGVLENQGEWINNHVEKWKDLLYLAYKDIGLSPYKYKGEIGLELAAKIIKKFEKKNNKIPHYKDKGMSGIYKAVIRGE